MTQEKELRAELRKKSTSKLRKLAKEASGQVKSMAQEVLWERGKKVKEEE